MRVEIIYKLVTGVIQFFYFPDRPVKGGTSWISRKGGNLRKGGIDLERGGGYDLPYQLWFDGLMDKQRGGQPEKQTDRQRHR